MPGQGWGLCSGGAGCGAWSSAWRRGVPQCSNALSIPRDGSSWEFCNRVHGTFAVRLQPCWDPQAFMLVAIKGCCYVSLKFIVLVPTRSPEGIQCSARQGGARERSDLGCMAPAHHSGGTAAAAVSCMFCGPDHGTGVHLCV